MQHMTFKAIVSTFIAFQMVFLPDVSFAQSSEFGSDFDRVFAPQSAEARLQLTVPIGQSQNSNKTKPRLDFVVRNSKLSADDQLDWTRIGRSSFEQRAYSEMRLGFTLENDPQWILNDQRLVFSPRDEAANIGTVGKIGLGVAAVAVVFVAVVAVAFVECESQEGGCFGDE